LGEREYILYEWIMHLTELLSYREYATVRNEMSLLELPVFSLLTAEED